MDPQQRLLLECVGEALLGGGGVAPSAGNVGVFVGLSSTDYAKVREQQG